MPCSVIAQRYALASVNKSLRALTAAGFGPLTEPYQVVARLRNTLLSGLGLTVPKPVNLVRSLVGLSPGSVRVWFDGDSGWFTEARVAPGAPPVYRHVTDAVAATILRGEMTHELEAELMKPDDYVGE